MEYLLFGLQWAHIYLADSLTLKAINLNLTLLFPLSAIYWMSSTWCKYANSTSTTSCLQNTARMTQGMSINAINIAY